MFNTQNTMRRMGHLGRDTLRGLVAAGGLCVVAGGARADAIHQGPPSVVAEVRRELAAVGDVAGLVSGYPEILPALAPPYLPYGDVISHSNNTRFVAEGSDVAADWFNSLPDPHVHRKGLLEDAPLPATASPFAAVPAPGSLWLLALGTLSARRRRRRA